MGCGNGSGNVIWSLIWLLVLIFLGFWLAGLCAFLYIIISPFSVCISGLGPFMEMLLKGISFPRICTEAMIGGKTFGEVAK